MFWILEDIGAAEALVARDGSGVTKVADLKGKKVATPFVSTSHFHLLYAMELAGLKPTDAQVLNMRPPEIAAAWARGDIDAAFIWDPALATTKKNGKVLVTSGELCAKGKCTFDGLVVSKKWAKANPDFMVKFVKAVAKADAEYRANPKGFTGDGSGIPFNDDGPGQHVVANAPTDIFLHMDVGPIAEAAAEIACRSLDFNGDGIGQADADVMPGIRVDDGDVLVNGAVSFDDFVGRSDWHGR